MFSPIFDAHMKILPNFDLPWILGYPNAPYTQAPSQKPVHPRFLPINGFQSLYIFPPYFRVL